MLKLTRRIDETIIIGDDIRITIVGIRGKQIRVGIEAPDSVTVHREEIYKALKQTLNGLDEYGYAGNATPAVSLDEVKD